MNKMNKKGETDNPMVIILYAIILILICLALITSVANTKSQQTKLSSIADEQYNLLTNGCYSILGTGTVNISKSACNITVSNWYPAGDWRRTSSPCYLSGVIVTNDTGTVLTLNTDYKINSSSGIIILLNTSTLYNSSATMNNNLLEIDYSYCEPGYLTASGDRSLANLWVTMMVLVLLVGVVVLVKKIWGDN